MRQISLFRLTALLCFTMLRKAQCYPDRTTGNKGGNATVPAIWNTHHSPYGKLTGVLSNGNNSLIAHNGSQLDLWRLEGDGYVLQKSCQLEGDFYKLEVLHNSNIACFLDKSFTLIIYDVLSCRRVFEKTFAPYNIDYFKTSSDQVFVETYQDGAKLFNWNGSHVEPGVSVLKFGNEFQMSSNGLVAFQEYTAYAKQREQLRYFHTSAIQFNEIRTGFEIGSYRLSPDGRYVVVSYENDESVAVYELPTNYLISNFVPKNLVFNGSSVFSGRVWRVLQDNDRLYMFFSNGHGGIADITIAYIDISEKLDNRNITFTTNDLDAGYNLFTDQIDFRRINGTSCLQAISREGQLNFFTLDSDGEAWVPLQ